MVLPVGIIDSHKVLSRGSIIPRLKRCEVKIGKPLNFSKYYTGEITEKTLKKVTIKIMEEIAKLIGQKYDF